MKIKLNRAVCNCWEAACEPCFETNFLGKEVKATACLVEVLEDGKEELSFVIHDRDGEDKVFVVNNFNLAEAIDSWMLAYDEQQVATEGE